MNKPIASYELNDKVPESVKELIRKQDAETPQSTPEQKALFANYGRTRLHPKEIAWGVKLHTPEEFK